MCRRECARITRRGGARSLTPLLCSLKSIIRELDRRELKVALGSISERCDPVAVLPVEIVGEVFTHLPLFAVWTLQCICRRWRTVLNSDGFLEAAVARWDRIHDPRDSALRAGDIVGVEGRVRHMQAMRLGRPFTAAIERRESVPSPLAGTHQAGLSNVALKGRFIAFVRLRDGVPNEVVLRDLVSGSTICKRGAAREAIMAIALTTKVLAFVSFDAKLNIYKLDHDGADEVIRLQLPSSNICALAGDENTIVLLSTTGGNHLITYSAHTGNLSSGFFDSQQAVDSHGPGSGPLVARGLLVNESEGVVDVFSSTNLDDPQKRDYHVGHLRFSSSLRPATRAGPICETLVKLDGVVLGTKSANGLLVVGQVQPVGVRGMFRLDLVPVSARGRVFQGEIPMLEHTVFFDTKTAKLTTEKLSCWIYPQLRWKDVDFECNNVSSISLLRSFGDCWTVAVGTTSVMHSPGYIQCTEFYWEDEDEVPFVTALINDSFLVLFQHFHPANGNNSIILVFCFDEAVRLAHGVSTGFWGDTAATGVGEEMEESGQGKKKPFCNVGDCTPHKLPYQQRPIVG